MLAEVQASIPLCDQVWVFDNSSADDPFQPVMTPQGGRVAIHQHPVPAWAFEWLND